MQSIRHIILFIKNSFMQLQRKWFALPLLLLFPLIIISMLAFLMIQFFHTDSPPAMQVGLIDLDETPETKMVMNLMSESNEFTNFIKVQSLQSEKEAEELLKNNKLTAYIIFPNQFADRLYNGESIKLPVIGNDKQRTESKLVASFTNSIATHINGAQANILTIDAYANDLNMDPHERREMLYKQFKEFIYFTLSKDQSIYEELITNEASLTPIQYYTISSWFIAITIWLFIFYRFLYTDDEIRMKDRMKLYGVTIFQQLFARMFTSFVVTMILVIITFFTVIKVIDKPLDAIDYESLSIIVTLYSLVLLTVFSISELLIRSDKLRLLVQTGFVGLIILISGAMIPSIYFPSRLQDYLAYSFPLNGLNEIRDIILNGNMYPSYDYLVISLIIGCSLFLILSFWKERVRS